MRALSVIMFVVGAIVVHAGVLLFGGLLFPNQHEQTASKKDVEVLIEDVRKDKDVQDKPEPEQEEHVDEDEAPPDPDTIAPAEMAQPSDDAPALDAASLSAIEAALNGASGGASEFGGSGPASLASGGRIGGTGRPGGASSDDALDGAFSMSEIDQRPRAVFQVAGAYPADLRSQKLEGVVVLIFVVDETGRVTNARVEKSTHQSFETPALEALKQWKFEPAVKGGNRVACRMRVPIRFQPR
jgi:protein TonB